MFRLKILKFAFLCVVFSVFLNANCLECHEKIEKFDEINHNFSCQTCHLKKEDVLSTDHAKIVAHPASNENMNEFCGECHEKQIKEYKNSNHFTHKNEIKSILTAFNMDLNLSISDFKSSNFRDLGEKESLVFDFMKEKCLTCHTNSQGSKGAFRGLGCMACHTHYANDGLYHGKDESVGKNLHSKTHELKKADNKTCQSCHNKFFVGADFMGKFPIDAHKDFRTPLDINGNFPNKFSGDFYHQLSPDIHAKNGLSCISCHTSQGSDLDKKDKFDDFFNEKSDFKTKSCEDCHEILPNIAHASYHENISCVACHASWQGNFYELNLIKDESKNQKKWENLIEFNGGKKNYHAIFLLMRFENLYLLNDLNSGKIAIARPIFQYNLIHFSKDGNQTLPFKEKKIEVFAPFAPHTIGKKAKNCELCHANPLMLNKTYGGVSELFIPSKDAKFINSTPLSKEQLNRLNSPFYKKIRAKMLK